MNGQLFKCQALVNAFGHDDTINSVDAFSLDVFNTNKHTNDCRCSTCSLIMVDGQQTYAQAVYGTSCSHGPGCKCVFCSPAAAVDTTMKRKDDDLNDGDAKKSKMVVEWHSCD